MSNKIKIIVLPHLLLQPHSCNGKPLKGDLDQSFKAFYYWQIVSHQEYNKLKTPEFTAFRFLCSGSTERT